MSEEPDIQQPASCVDARIDTHSIAFTPSHRINVADHRSTKAICLLICLLEWVRDVPMLTRCQTGVRKLILTLAAVLSAVTTTQALSDTSQAAPASVAAQSISQEALSVGSDFTADTDKPRVVSINLCADQLLLALADDAQILSLTNLSHDPAGSVHYRKARLFPTNTGIIEEVLPYNPDVVIAGQFTSRYTLQLLEAVGLRIELIPIASSIDVMLANIEKVAGWLQQQQRGEEIVAGLRQRLDALPEPPSTPPLAAIYDPNGYTVGEASLRGEALKIAGWHNVATDRGISSYGQLPLETLLKLAPDALVESPYSAGTWSRAQAMNSHPALSWRGLDTRVISIPSSHTICGGPWTLDVIDHLLQARMNIGNADDRGNQ